MLFEHRGHHPQLGIRSILVEKTGGALVATGGGDGAIRFWDIRMGKCIMTGTEHVQGIACISQSGCMFVSGGLDNKIVGWDLRQVDRPLYSLPACSSAVTGLAFCGNSHFASCSFDGVLSVWHIGGNQRASLALPFDAKVTGVVYKDDSSLFTCSFDRTVRQFALEKDALLG
jgi:WD40 repeat protein